MDYLSSLGKTQTAAVQRDADIGVAEAERDAGIRVRFNTFKIPEGQLILGLCLSVLMYIHFI